jgi:hypothetical protein
VALFLLPFAGFGTFAAWQAVQRAFQANWREALFFLLFAVVFGGVGFGGLALVMFGKRKLAEQDELKARHPNEPWLWQKDWASARIDDTSRLVLWTSWIFASLWNLVSIPAGYAGVRAALYEQNKAGLVALLFPIAGVGLLVWAIRTSLRLTKYGVSRLELGTLPGVIGHTFAGTVRVNGALEAPEGFHVTLSCVRRVTTRSGKDSSTTESILWQEERQLRGEPSRDASGMSTRIPIAFRLPADARPCDSSDPNDRILWRLTLSAKVAGLDYDSTFEVPVFRTAASDRALSDDEERLTHDQLVTADYRQPSGSRIIVKTRGKGTEIQFPAARNLGAATGTTLFTVIWLAVIWFLIHFKAPLLFPVVFGLFGLILVYGMVQLWLEVSRVVVGAGTVTVARGYLSPGSERIIAAAEIADVLTAIGMQAGSTLYYDVVIKRKDGRKVIAGRAVRDKREAEWLALTIRTAAGLEQSSPAELRRAS